MEMAKDDNGDWMVFVFYWLIMILGVAFFSSIIFLCVRSAFSQTIVRNDRVPLGIREVTVFHAVTGECDDDPDIGAGGRVAIAGKPTGHWFACNWLSFGTRIIIPAITGNVVWTCRDRTARKCRWRIDLLYPLNRPGFGLRRETVFRIK
jgi:hypothetical protein